MRTNNVFITSMPISHQLYTCLLLVLGFVTLQWSIPPETLADEEFTHYHCEVEFRHYIHTEGQGIACNICHSKLKNGRYIMIGHDACASCHIKQINVYEPNKNTCGFCHPKFKIKGNKITVELKMQDPPRNIFTHTPFLENICHICHGAMLDEYVEIGKVRTEKEIKRLRKVSHRFYFAKECDKCHVTESISSPPKNHKDDWMNKHKEVAPAFRCTLCHENSFCKSCHEDVY